MGKVIDIKTKKKPEQETIKYEDPLVELDTLNFMVHVASFLPYKSKNMFIGHMKSMNELCELVLKDGSPAIKQKLLDMGFFINERERK